MAGPPGGLDGLTTWALEDGTREGYRPPSRGHSHCPAMSTPSLEKVNRQVTCRSDSHGRRWPLPPTRKDTHGVCTVITVESRLARDGVLGSREWGCVSGALTAQSREREGNKHWGTHAFLSQWCNERSMFLRRSPRRARRRGRPLAILHTKEVPQSWSDQQDDAG